MDIATILTWFKRGCKPTEAQFAATFQSFRHKDDTIPMGDVSGLTMALANKSENGHTHTLAEITDYDGGDKEVINAMVAQDSTELEAFTKTAGMYYILLSDDLLYQCVHDEDTDTDTLAEVEPDGKVVYSAYDVDENLHIYLYNVPNLMFQDVTNEQVDKTIYTNNLDSLITRQLANGVYSVVYINRGIDDNTYGDAYTLTVGDGSIASRVLKCRTGWAQTILVDEVYQWKWHNYSYNGHGHQQSDIEGLTEALAGKADVGHNHDSAYAPLNHTHSQYLTQHQDISGLQPKTDNSLLTTAKNIVSAINELWNKFADYALANHNHNGVYQPAGDYASRSHGHAIGAIEGLSDALAGKAASNHNHDGVYQPAGNYLTQHQDISGKQDKTDNTLPTTSKTIVGAIAELWNKFANYALANHNHDGVYQPAGSYADANHNHDSAYSGINHNHDGVYQPAGNYAAADHTHSQYLTQHQDISGKQDKTDNTLPTTSKTIVGAIAELWNKFTDYLKGIQHVTYAQLVTLRNNSGLVAGQWYRITDYMTTVANDTEARSAGHPFDLLVMATSSNTLSEEAKAIKSSRDSNGYFTDANLNAWKVWYCLDNDTTRFQWADTENGKGVIWRMIDEWQNDCPYDFKNVQFKRYKVTPTTPVPEDVEEQQLLADLDGTYIGTNAEMQGLTVEDYDDFVWVYTFSLGDRLSTPVDASLMGYVNDEQGEGYGYKGYYGDNVILPCTCHQTIDDEQQSVFCLNNVVWFTNNVRYRSLICGNRIDSECINMTLSGHGTHIKHDCQNIIMGDGCLEILSGLDASCVRSGTVAVVTRSGTIAAITHSGTIAVTIHSGTTSKATHSGTVVVVIRSGTTAIVIRSGTNAGTIHSGTVVGITHSGTVVIGTHSGTTSNITRSGTIAVVTHSGTIAMRTHSGTTAAVTRSGTVVVTIHSGTVVHITRSGTTAEVTHSGTTVAISLFTTAFNTWRFLAAAPFLPMFRTPKYSTERTALTRQICYKYRSKRMQITANMQV